MGRDLSWRKFSRSSSAGFMASTGVAHLLDVIAQLADALVIARFEAQEIGDLRLRSFDPRTEDGLKSHVGQDEQVRVGKKAADTGEAVQGPGSVIQLTDEFVGVVQPSREGRGVIGHVALAWDVASLTAWCRRKVLHTHDRSHATLGLIVKEIGKNFNKMVHYSSPPR